MGAVLYIRVSTEDQVNEGHSLEMQEARLRAYCDMRALDVAELIVDAGVSAGKPLATRPGGRKLLAAVAEGRATNVVALRLDRIFRDTVDCLTRVKAWDEAGVAFHLVDLGGQTLDTSSPMGKFFLTVMAGAATLERDITGQRIKDVKRHEKAKGSYLGGHAPYGYHHGEDGGLEPDADEQAIIDEARELRAAGLSLRRIGERLTERGLLPRKGGQWHAETVKALLAAEVAA